MFELPDAGHVHDPANVHPLLRHPRPIPGDYAKVQRMLGLVAHVEENAKGLQREKSVTTRWLERPLHQHLQTLESSPEEQNAETWSNVDSVIQEKATKDYSALLLQRTASGRPISMNINTSASLDPQLKHDKSTIMRRPVPTTCPQPISYHAQSLQAPGSSQPSYNPSSPNLHPPRPFSRQRSTEGRRISSYSSIESGPYVLQNDAHTISPMQYSTNAPSTRPVSFQHQGSASEAISIHTQQRPRISSFGAQSHQRGRSGSKIASSRGFRNSSYSSISQSGLDNLRKAVPGEQIETDGVCQCPSQVRSGVVPSSPRARAASSQFDFSSEKATNDLKPRKRWSATLKKFTNRRPSIVAQDSPGPDAKIEALRRLNNTKDNLSRNDTNYQPPTLPKVDSSSPDPLHTPIDSPLDVRPSFSENLPPPFAPWTNVPPCTASTRRRRVSGSSSLSPTRLTERSASSDSLPQPSPATPHSNRSSPFNSPTTNTASPLGLSVVDAFFTNNLAAPRTTVSRRSTPSPERTCLRCHISKPHSEFTTYRIAANCWHEPATCIGCLQAWMLVCLVEQGSDGCSCPECGEHMTVKEVRMFTTEVVRAR